MTEPLEDSEAIATEAFPDRRSLLGPLIGRHPDIQSVSLILLVGTVLLGLGVGAVGSSVGHTFTLGGAFDGITSVIWVTLPAAILVGLATTLNILSGAIFLRILGYPVFRSSSDLILGGFAAAVFLDSAALFLLGSFGLFRWFVLMALQSLLIGYWILRGPRLRLVARRPRLKALVPLVWWIPVAAIWAYPLIVQLASPAVPFMDVLTNHVAPVEHVRVFGSFSTLTTLPSPIVGPSRLMLGYVALLSELTTVAGLEAILAVAAFAVPSTILIAIAFRQLATRLFGRVAGFWVMLTLPLTFTFMRLPDARGTVVVFPLSVWALGLLATNWPPATVEGEGSQGHPAFLRTLPDWGLTLALGSAVLLHPLGGLIVMAAASIALLLLPERLGPRLVPALAGALVIALPQFATMLSMALPSWIGFVCLAAALPVGVVFASAVDRIDVPWRMLRGLSVVAILVGLIFIARSILPSLAGPGTLGPTNVLPVAFPLLSLLCVLGVLMSPRSLRVSWILLGCGIAGGLLAWVAADAIPAKTLTQQSIHYEVPKTVQYWLPTLLAVGGAGTLAAVYHSRRLGTIRLAVLFAFVAVSFNPFGSPLLRGYDIAEHTGAESVALGLREAQLGYWVGYHDSRYVINASDREVVDRIRVEEDAGRLTADMRLLHLAATFQQWGSVPIGVFDGTLETSISLQPEHSDQTEGGRLLGFDSLNTELAGDYGYVVLETRGLPVDMAWSLPGTIREAGYHEIWFNSTAIIYARNPS